jgi:hypothetical protein
MRVCWRVVAVAFIFFLTGSSPLVADETERHEPDIDMSDPTVSAPNPAANAARAKALAAHIEQLKCRHMADAQGVLPRDRTDFILRCMEE